MANERSSGRSGGHGGGTVAWRDASGGTRPIRSDPEPARPEPKVEGLSALPPEAVDDVESLFSVDDPDAEDPIRAYLMREVLRLRESVKERDETVAYLNRAVGALEQRVSDDTSGNETRGPGLLSSVGRFFGRLLARSAPEDDKGSRADEDEWFGTGIQWRDPLVPFGDVNAGRTVIGVTAFGLSRDEMHRVLDVVEESCRKRDAVPVVLTDSVFFEDLRERKVVFEYLPSEAVRDRFAPDLEWPLYFRRRLKLFKRKWNPDGFISFGTRSPVEGVEPLLVVE